MKLRVLLLSIFSSIFALTSCEEDAYLGPDVESIGNPPVPTSELVVSTDTVNFIEDETIHFDLSFETPTRWLLTLEGQSSGFTHTIEDVTDAISESNSEWNGSSDSAYFQVEQVIATVTFPNYPEEPALVDTFYIEDIDKSNVEAVLYSDFSSISSRLYNFGGAVPSGGGWGTDWPLTVNTNTQFSLFDGNAYLYMFGAPWQANNPYIDIVEMPANLGDTISSTYLPLYSDPDRVYVNLAVYNTGTEDTWFQVQCKEGDATRTWHIRPDWDGWKLISIKYSDLVSEGVYDPTAVDVISFVLLSDEDISVTSRSSVSIAVDQLSFSFDAPLGTVNY